MSQCNIQLMLVPNDILSMPNLAWHPIGKLSEMWLIYHFFIAYGIKNYWSLYYNTLFCWVLSATLTGERAAY